MKTILFAAMAILLCGCSSTIKVPANTVEFQTPYGHLKLIHPQNTDMSNVVVAIETNGTISAKIGSLRTVNNPEVISKTAAGQAALVKANGEAIVNAMKAAEELAGTVGGAAAKQMAK